MAKSRRMFNTQITNSDAFNDMSIGARLLYYELGMVADDDGFVNNPKTIAKSKGIPSKCYDELIQRHFLIVFDSKVVVIKHWWVHNNIRKERRIATTYQEELSQLTIKENGVYTTKK